MICLTAAATPMITPGDITKKVNYTKKAFQQVVFTVETLSSSEVEAVLEKWVSTGYI